MKIQDPRSTGTNQQLLSGATARIAGHIVKDCKYLGDRNYLERHTQKVVLIERDSNCLIGPSIIFGTFTVLDERMYE